MARGQTLQAVILSLLHKPFPTLVTLVLCVNPIADLGLSRRLFALLLLAGALVAADGWDWLPVVVRDGDAVWLSLRPKDGTAGWSAQSSGRVLPLTASGGALTLVASTGDLGAGVDLVGAGRQHHVRLVRPGAAKGLRVDADGRLRLGDDLAVLRCPAVEDQQDRRWLLLRHASAPTPLAVRCGRHLAVPTPAPGHAALPDLAIAAQALDVSGQEVLVQVPADLRAAWRHRDRRLALGWLVSDLLSRGARVVVLVLPVAPTADADLLAPLAAETRTVAELWRCAVIDLPTLSEHRWWEVAPGTLGPGLNVAGQAEHDRLLAPWLRQ